MVWLLIVLATCLLLAWGLSKLMLKFISYLASAEEAE